MTTYGELRNIVSRRTSAFKDYQKTVENYSGMYASGMVGWYQFSGPLDKYVPISKLFLTNYTRCSHHDDDMPEDCTYYKEYILKGHFFIDHVGFFHPERLYPAEKDLAKLARLGGNHRSAVTMDGDELSTPFEKAMLEEHKLDDVVEAVVSQQQAFESYTEPVPSPCRCYPDIGHRMKLYGNMNHWILDQIDMVIFDAGGWVGDWQCEACYHRCTIALVRIPDGKQHSIRRRVLRLLAEHRDLHHILECYIFPRDGSLVRPILTINARDIIRESPPAHLIKPMKTPNRSKSEQANKTMKYF